MGSGNERRAGGQRWRNSWTLGFVALVALMGLLLVGYCSADGSNAYLSKPNRDKDKSFERVLGLGVVLPYPYFQKPRYRYPVYDRKGRGSLLYGYGGRETFQYKTFTPIEGHH